MAKIKWNRYSISEHEYKTQMGLYQSESQLEKCLQNSENYKPKYEKAFEIASDIRKFEIDMFWKRAGFFWAFIVAIYTAYYHVLTKIYISGSEYSPCYKHGELPLLVLSALGLFFCFSWLLSSKGSKHWQENWENHLDLLEDKVTGPLYKTYEAGQAYSESKITIAAGWLVTACSFGLLLFEFIKLLEKRNLCTNFKFLLILVFSIFVLICLYAYSIIVTGNTSNSGEIKFQTKIYKDFKDEQI